MNKQKRKIKINKLQLYAQRNYDNTIPNSDAAKTNITPEFWDEIMKMTTQKPQELINIQIIGELASAKSTTAAEIARRINEKYLGKPMQINYITRDQIEFARYILENDAQNICLVIDEWSEMAKTGYGATTEEAFLTEYQDIHAQKYVNRISCSRGTIIDKGSTILLKVIGKDTQKQITQLEVIYKILTPNGEINQTIGYIRINVKKTLQAPWYQTYRKRKFQKMELLTKHGIANQREMEAAEIILETHKDLAKMAQLGAISKDIVDGYIESIKRTKKRFLSIIGKEDLVNKTYGLLKMEKEISKLKTLTKAIIAKHKGAKIPPEKLATIKEIQEKTQDMQKRKQIIINNYKELTEINKQYKRLD